MARKTVKRRGQGDGAVRQLKSGKWQARWRDEDGCLRPAPTTFDTKLDAEAWLDAEPWLDPDDVAVVRADPVLRDYAETWLAGRDLKPRTRAEYRRILDQRILPPLGDLRLSRLTSARVRAWHGDLDPKKPTSRAHAYSLLKAVLTTAVEDEILAANPCRIRGAGQSKPVHQPRPATLAELEAIVQKMPARYRAMVLLAAWGGFRFGELTELRRGDIDGDVVRVTRGVVRVDGTFLVGDPKSHAGKRTVTLPPHLVPVLTKHLAEHVPAAPDALLFPARHGGHMAPATLYRVWYPARKAAGRPDLRWHDLRHTGATLYATAGATLAETMARLGHSTTAAAMRYQHAAQDRQTTLAAALSALAVEAAAAS